MKRYIRASRSKKPYHIVMHYIPQQIAGHADTLEEAIKIAERVHRKYKNSGYRVNKASVVTENGNGGYDYLYTTGGDL